MAYLRDNSNSELSGDDVDDDAVDMVPPAMEEKSDDGIVMPACIIAISLRSLVCMRKPICPNFVFFMEHR